MDPSRFDAWTRRRFGAAAASAVTALLGARAEEGARARRKKRKRRSRTKHRCEQLRTPCNPRNDRELCCNGLACGLVPELGGHHCCRWRYVECEINADCCGNLRCAGAPGFCDVVAGP